MDRTSDLEMLITLAYSEGFSRFGDLQLDQQVYSSRIRSIIREHLGGSPVSGAITPFMLRLYSSDLYLATACAQQSARLASHVTIDLRAEYSKPAWRVLSTNYREFIGELARLFTGGTQEAADLANAVLDSFLIPDDSGTSRISLYDGRSSLYTWLRVVVRQASDEIIRAGAVAEAKDVDAKAGPPARSNVEQSTAEALQQSALAELVASAFHKLAPKERLLLLWHYKDELPTEKIAALLGIDESRIPSFLERTQVKLASQVGEILGEKNRISAKDIAGFIREISGPDLPT